MQLILQHRGKQREGREQHHTDKKNEEVRCDEIAVLEQGGIEERPGSREHMNDKEIEAQSGHYALDDDLAGRKPVEQLASVQH